MNKHKLAIFTVCVAMVKTFVLIIKGADVTTFTYSKNFNDKNYLYKEGIKINK